MKRLLWFCNVPFSNSPLKQTGGWLQPLAQAVSETGLYQIGSVAIGKSDTVIKQECGAIMQWQIPARRIYNHGQTACIETCQEVKKIVDEYKPDLVHIWGTEGVWASVYAKGFINCKTLIDIQGLLYDYSDYFYGQLTMSEIIKCIHLKEIIMPWRTLWWKKHVFYKRGIKEYEYLRTFERISTQSQWVRDHLQKRFSQAQYFNTRIMLRKAFYESEGWKVKENRTSPIVFTTCSAAVSYKGMHIAIKALNQLKSIYSDVKLRIAGNINLGGILKDGYSIFLQKLIEQYGLENNVEQLGMIDETTIIRNLQECDVCLIPSFVETYCLALAESMIVGVPTVVSYAGAMPEQAVDGQEALFYNPLDYMKAAALINRLYSDKELSTTISINARRRKMKDNDPKLVTETQLSIYNSILF